MIPKSINIQKQEESTICLKMIKERNYGNIDIKIRNLHLKRINELIGKMLFKKNDAFISAETLWEIMNQARGKNKHHFHQLTIEDVRRGLLFLKEPICIIQSDNNRVLMISTFISSFNLPLLVVIEMEAGLVHDKDARINKIITMFPKDDIDGFMNKYPINNIIYKK